MKIKISKAIFSNNRGIRKGGFADKGEKIMKKEWVGGAALLLVILVIGLFLWISPAKGKKYKHDDPAIPGDKIEKENIQWTLIFYLAADNAQEAYADASIEQLVAGVDLVENHPQILIFIDRLSIPGTEVIEMDGDETTSLNYPEKNSADGTVLKEFAEYALNQAKYENVAFIMKSEGLSWRGIGRDNTHDPDIDDQLMPNGDLALALIDAQAAIGKNLDLLVLEGSIMAFIEVIYELREVAPVIVATQSKIQLDGLPWTMIIEDMGATPTMGSIELGMTIADNHYDYYSDKGNNGVPGLDTSINFAALTVFDLSCIEEVLEAHKNWAAITWNLFDDLYNLLPHARDLADVGGFGEVTEFDYQFDIETFMVESLRLIEEAGLAGLTDDEYDKLNTAVSEYIIAQHDMILYERNPDDGSKLKAANGLSIWYPPTWNKYETRDESYEIFGSTMYYEDSNIDLDWVTDSNWVTYLYKYFDRADATLAGNGPVGDEPPKKGVFRRIDSAN